MGSRRPAGLVGQEEGGRQRTDPAAQDRDALALVRPRLGFHCSILPEIADGYGRPAVRRVRAASAVVFSGTAGQLRSIVSGASTYVYGDVDGDKVADFAIMVTGKLTFVAGDFVL